MNPAKYDPSAVRGVDRVSRDMERGRERGTHDSPLSDRIPSQRTCENHRDYCRADRAGDQPDKTCPQQWWSCR